MLAGHLRDGGDQFAGEVCDEAAADSAEQHQRQKHADQFRHEGKRRLLDRGCGLQQPDHQTDDFIVRDLLSPSVVVVLVVPVDSAAPKGRLILPQQQTIRDILEAKAISVVAQDAELPAVLSSLKNKPRLVITGTSSGIWMYQPRR